MLTWVVAHERHLPDRGGAPPREATGKGPNSVPCSPTSPESTLLQNRHSGHRGRSHLSAAMFMVAETKVRLAWLALLLNTVFTRNKTSPHSTKQSCDLIYKIWKRCLPPLFHFEHRLTSLTCSLEENEFSLQGSYEPESIMRITSKKLLLWHSNLYLNILAG